MFDTEILLMVPVHIFGKELELYVAINRYLRQTLPNP